MGVLFGFGLGVFVGFGGLGVFVGFGGLGVLVGLTVFVGFIVLVGLTVLVGITVTVGTGVRVFGKSVRVPIGVNVNDGVDNKVIVKVGVADGLKPPGSIEVGV